MSSGNSLAVAVSFLLCCTCCLAYPSYRRAYNYFPPMMAEYGPSSNNWDVAQEPLSYDQPEDFYAENNDQQWADIEALSDLMEMYDENPRTPVWGQIVNERPETELEELKAEQIRHEHRAEKTTTTTTTSKPSTTVAASKETSNRKSVKVEDVLPVASHPHQGQKEIPLLRPPMMKVKSPVRQEENSGADTETESDSEPQAVIAQRRSSPVAEKPSAYDTLRKYLSIEDALQKEAQKKRRIGNRQMKRSSIVTDTETLAGQLNNLKKTVM